jgi:hypothetical protein
MASPKPLPVIGAGLSKGWKAYLWLLKIILPLSFLTMLLVYSSWMSKLDIVLEPVMGVLHLPAVAALPLLVGMITGIYGGLATMAVLPLNQAELTLIAIFLMISHNLVQEGIIQAQSGIRPLKIILIRLTASILTIICVAPLLGAGLERSVEPMVTSTAAAMVGESLEQTVKQWGLDTLILVFKLLAILLSLMVVIEAMKAYALVEKIQKWLAPLLKLLGLGPQTGLLWLVGVLFGVAFGGAIIKEEFEGGYLTSEDLERLHISIGINHSVIEDPIIFMLLGLHLFWLVVPRLVASVVAVYVLMGWQKLRLRLNAA